MKKEEACRRIDAIDYYLQHHTDDYSERDHEAMMMAKKALEQESVIDPVIESAYKTGYEMGKSIAMIKCAR